VAERDVDYERFQRTGVNEQLGVELVSASAERVELRLEVGPKVHQPFGILHGGSQRSSRSPPRASAGDHRGRRAQCGWDRAERKPRALDARRRAHCGRHPVKAGRRIQVWAIELTDDKGRVICVSRCTLAVLDAEPQ